LDALRCRLRTTSDIRGRPTAMPTLLPRRALRLALLAVLVWCALPAFAVAQVRPDLAWQTISTERIRVHFTPELEELARRTLANAERAYAQLSAELRAPRGPVDIVVADNVDFANGYATPFPSNRIVVYARPPVDELQLRNHADWNLTLVTHEMAHIFHLDRSRGVWGAAQRVFGRAAPLFPSTYAPNWLIEGIAIHYETRLTTGGRMASAEYPAAVRALASGSALPPLHGVAAPRPFFPGGNSTYLLGAFLVERALLHDPTLGAPASMHRLVERMSGRLLPWRHDANARDAVGASFTELYGVWRDSVRRAELADAASAPSATGAPLGVQLRTTHEWTAAFPRFVGDADELVYVAYDQRQNPGLYTIAPDGRRKRVGRRNSVDANAPWSDRVTVYAELDRTDPYSVRSDLYRGTGVRRRRLTESDRLSHPDVHDASGRVVAVRSVPGTTELVTLRADDPYPVAITQRSLDRTWSEPRWSRDGTRIAAAQWERGGQTSIVVLDADGRELRRFAPRARDRADRLAVTSSPAWLPGDSLIIFVSDHEGTPMVYRGDVRTSAYDRLWATRTALRSPDASADGRQLAATMLLADGWAVVTKPMPSLPPLPQGPPEADLAPLFAVPAAATDTFARARSFQSWETLKPTWWLPSVAVSDEDATLLGVMSGGRDVVGRHNWQGVFFRNLSRPEFSWNAGYSYAGLGNPVLSLGADRDWAYVTIVDAETRDPVGTLARTTDVISTSAYFVRPRVRLTSYAIVGAEVGFEQFSTYPTTLIALIDPVFERVRTNPGGVASVGFSSMQRPGLSVSVEDGVAMQGTYRYRGTGGVGRVAVNEAILTGSAAKSLPLPGFARHVVAVRGAFGAADVETRNPFELGGISGGSLEVLPGLSYGDPQRTFFVRGFTPGVQRGNRAVAGSAEYRAPLVRVGRGYRMLPVFLQKLSVLAFADAGTAWCEGEVAGSSSCSASIVPRRWLASAGGELVFDAALQYDILYRFRLGVASPVQGRDVAGQSATLYFTLGSTF
jgi:hypothetical protein